MSEVIGKDFYTGLVEMKDGIKLDKTLFIYFNRCSLVNKVLSKNNVFERRDKFRFLVKKKLKIKIRLPF